MYISTRVHTFTVKSPVNNSQLLVIYRHCAQFSTESLENVYDMNNGDPLPAQPVIIKVLYLSHHFSNQACAVLYRPKCDVNNLKPGKFEE